MNIELLVNEHCQTGENPLWDEQRRVVYWCDIPDGEIYELNPDTGLHRLIYKSDIECGAITIQADGSLLLLRTNEMGILDPLSGQYTQLRAGFAPDTGRFNDCIPDATGRVFAGTVDQAPQMRGGIYCIERNGTSAKLWTGTACANGWGFTPDGTGAYFIDSTARTVTLYQYDAATGALTNPRTWLHTPDDVPDGMVMDRAGNLWIAFYASGHLRHFNAHAELLEEVKIPVNHVTCCMFGGDDLMDLYVTTAAEDKGSPDTADGALFRIRPAIGGVPRYRSQVS